MSSTRFLQGIFDFEGRGLHEPFLLDRRLNYTVPAGNEAQFVYFRGGNSSAAPWRPGGNERTGRHRRRPRGDLMLDVIQPARQERIAS